MVDDATNQDNEAQLRIQRQRGEAPGPEAAHQEERKDEKPVRGTSEEGGRVSRNLQRPWLEDEEPGP